MFSYLYCSMKRLIIMFISIVAIGITSQAQGVTQVQNEDGIEIGITSPFVNVISNENAFADVIPPTVRVVSYIYEATPELNKTVVTTSNKHYAEVLLENEYGLIKSIAVNDGKFEFTYSNKVLENQIQTKLISANVGKTINKNLTISTHIVRYLS